MTSLERVRELAASVAAAHGLELFDVTYGRESGRNVLRVVLDRPGPSATAEESVSLEHCARVSEELSAVLDVEDVVPDGYTLEVSSPGLDRPLRTRDDYERFAGGWPRSSPPSRWTGRRRLRDGCAAWTAKTCCSRRSAASCTGCPCA